MRPLPRSRLGNLVPSLVQSHALVALVPATGELEWAAQAAWDVARAATQDDRRVALVDLWLDEPRLHEVVGLSAADGIVDAFEYGVSLSHAAREVDGVHFIAAGSATAHPADLFAAARWRKLHAGFRSEGALLLVYLPAGALAQLAAVPDGVIALAPEGLDASSPVAQSLASALERGGASLGVVRERWTPAPLPRPVEPGRRPSRPLPHPHPERPHRRVRPAFVTLALVGSGLGGWALFAPAREAFRARILTEPPRAAAPASTLTPRAPTPPPTRTPAPKPPPLDSLPWTVQLAAYSTLDKALAHADRLASSTGVRALVTPLAQQGSGTVWYRVLAGAYPTREAAAAARAAMWRHGAAPRNEGELLRAPFSFRTDGPADVSALRQLGLPAIRWSSGDVLIGAFETREQAGATKAQLGRAGIRASLITRVGTTP